MAHDARGIANFFLEISWRQRLPITHLALQKIIFFAHAWHLAKFNKPLVGQKFEAWQYGPVVRVLYDQLKEYKSQPISNPLRKIDSHTGEWVYANVALDDAEQRFLTDLFKYYSQFNAGHLVDLTHAEDGPWEKAWKKAVDSVAPGMTIPDEDIRIWILRTGGREGMHTH